MTNKEVSVYLCYYDLRNIEGIAEYKDNPEMYGLDKEDFVNLGPYAKKDCCCDNCFYGRHKLANYILKLQHPI
jgi:hypothetical protein